MFWGAVGLLTVSTAGPVFLPSSGQAGRPISIVRSTSVDLQKLAKLTVPMGLEEMETLTAGEAFAANRSLPFSASPVEAASPFRQPLEWRQTATYHSAVECLTAAVYYEAAGEGEVGQRAVAQVVLNRVRHPAFPSSICGVIFQGSELRTGCQFTFTCDGSLLRKASARGWASAQRIAIQALQGTVEPTIGMATHYHANYVFPYWAPRLDKVAAIDTHIFYRWSGPWGKRRAFSQSYTGESVGSPHIEAAWLLEQFDVHPLDSALAASADELPQLRPNSAAPLAEMSRPSRLRADEDKGTLKVDGTASELVINSERNRAPAVGN